MTDLELAREWLDHGHDPGKGYGLALEKSLAAFLSRVRLDEAKWWRYLAQMHEESYFAVEGDKRLAALEQAAGGSAAGSKK